MRVPEGTRAAGMTLREIEAELEACDAFVVGVIRHEVRLSAFSPRQRAAAGRHPGDRGRPRRTTGKRRLRNPRLGTGRDRYRVVGGVGVLALSDTGLATYHVKEANLLGVALGAALFGVGMVLYGYCPGTGIAAIATGSLHALVGAFGMIVGAIVYALSFDWVKANILSVAALGKVRLPDLTGVPDLIWFAGLAIVAAVLFAWAERRPTAKTTR